MKELGGITVTFSVEREGTATGYGKLMVFSKEDREQVAKDPAKARIAEEWIQMWGELATDAVKYDMGIISDYRLYKDFMRGDIKQEEFDNGVEEIRKKG